MTASRRMGILSRTLNSNSTIRWIVPARVRSRLRNDVVLVGNTCITLREFLPNGQLADPIAQLDLDTQILAVKVVSAQLQIVPILEAILKQECDEFRYEVGGKPLDDTQPPQILVLSTASAELLYVYAKDGISGRARFMFARRPLLGPANTLISSGRHLAVDPESRAMAVTPSSDTFGVFQLKNVQQIKSEIDQWHPRAPESFKPITEQRYVQVDGHILKMDFLKSQPQDSDKIIILLLVARGGTTRLLLYQWNNRGPLLQMRSMRTSGEILPPQDSFPLLLIPSSRYTSFFIVTETGVVLYDNVHTDQSERREDAGRAPRMGQSSAVPLWVQWAKPARHKKHMDEHDDFILVREDGLVRSHIISHKTSIRFESSFDYGSLGMKVDTAFCMLGGPIAQGGDIIIAGGDGVDGGVFDVQPRKHPAQTQRLPNTARLRDMVVIEPSMRVTHARSPAVGQKHQLFAGLDNDDMNGTVAELEYGVEAPVVCNVAYPDVSSIDRLWTLKQSDQNKLWILMSHPFHTSLLVFDMETFEVQELDATHLPGLDFEEATQAAVLVNSQYLMQVTSKSINFSHAKQRALQLSLIDAFGSECICAYTPIDAGLLFSVHRSGADYRLYIVSLSEQPLDKTLATFKSISLQNRPLSFHFSEVNKTGLLLMGTETGILQAVVLQRNADPYMAFQHDMRELMDTLEPPVISSVALLFHLASRDALLICGLRNGFLILVNLILSENGREPPFEVRNHSQQQIGTTAVHISSTTSLSHTSVSALVSCQHTLMRISLFASKSGLDYEISNIWFTNQSTPLRRQPLLHAVHQASRLSEDLESELNGLIVAASDDGLLLASQVVQPQILSRRLPVTGKPRKMIYSRFLDKVVVASECHESMIFPTDDLIGPSNDPFSFLPILQMIDRSTINQADNSQPGFLTIGEAGEQVRAIVNWSPTDGEMHFEMIVVALERQEPEMRRSTGKVICISAKHFGKGLLTTEKIKVVARYPGRIVTALCPFGQSSLVVAVDEQVIIHHLDVTTRAWSVMCRSSIPSPATSISAQGSLLYIATHAHSLIVLEKRDKQLELHQTDWRARAAKYSVVSADTSFVTTVSKNGTSLIGFGSRIPVKTTEICAAHTPTFVDEIRQYNIQNASDRHSLQFVACAADGAICYFSTLNYDEWRLLRYVESFSRLRRYQSLRSTLANSSAAAALTRSERSKGGPHLRQKQICRPSDMHVRGDSLQDLLDGGTDAFLRLLSIKSSKGRGTFSGVKTENEVHMKIATLRSLAQAVPAVSDCSSDEQILISRLFIWIRKLLNPSCD